MADTAINEYKDEIVRLEIKNFKELEDFRLKWLSKKGILTELFSNIKNIPPEEKKSYGLEINNLKTLAEQKFSEISEALASQKDAKAKNELDLSLEGSPISIGSLHPLTIIRNRLVEIFSKFGFV